MTEAGRATSDARTRTTDERVQPTEHEHRLQHPAVSAALSARNAISAEMAMAGRAAHHPGDACWHEARTALLEPGDAAWILASDAYAQMRDDLACAGAAAAETLGNHGAALAALAVPVAGATGRAPSAEDDAPQRAPLRKPAARRRREWLAMAGWFAVGGAGGLALGVLVRFLEVMIAWR